MKVLIFAQYDVFSLSLVSRLNKEGDQIFLVTGKQKKDKTTPKNVFQEYNFTYDSDSIAYVLKAVQPDVVIYTGALDSGFDWGNESDEASGYLAGLTNTIIHCRNLDIKQFIYISSLAIFSGIEEEFISEETEPAPMCIKDRTILIGEEVCRHYFDLDDFNVNIIRIGEVYGTYKDKVLENNIGFKMIQEAIYSNTVTAYSNISHNLIYVDDAIDYIYRIIQANPVDERIYHVSSKEFLPFAEETLAIIVQEFVKEEVEIKNKEPDFYHNNHIYKSVKQNPIAFYEKYYATKGLRNVYAVMEKWTKESDKKPKEKRLSLRYLLEAKGEKNGILRTLIESFLFFLLVQGFVMLTQDASFYETIDIYLLFILVVAVIYGYLQAIFAVVLSVIGRLYIGLNSNGQYTSLNDEHVYLWIIQIFIIGALVGYLKSRYKRKYEDFNDEVGHLQDEIANIKEINDSNMNIKSVYETRLLNYKDSFARIYNVLSQFNVIEPERVIFKAIHVLCDMMNTKNVAIYSCDNNMAFCRLMAASSDRAMRMSKTIRASEHEEMFAKLKNREIFVNSDLNADYPMMVGGTYAKGHLQTIIMIWDIPFENSNLYEINNFGILCTMIGETMNRAYEYMDNINKSYNRTEYDILDAEAFEKIHQLYLNGKNENVVDFSLLKVEEPDNLDLNGFYRLLKEQIRDTDYLGVNSIGETCILLTNTNHQEASFVVNRLEKKDVVVKGGVAYDT